MIDYDKLTLVLWGVCLIFGGYVGYVKRISNKQESSQ